MADTKTISTLNQLLETCRDGEMGFWRAAEQVRDEGLKWLFRGAARKRAQFAEELKEEIHRLGGFAAEGGSFAGSVHRGLMGMEGKAHNDATILAGTARGENRAVRNYEAALEALSAASGESIVKNQYLEIKDLAEQVTALEKEWKERD